MVSSQGDERREDHQHDANQPKRQRLLTAPTSPGVFEDVVKPANVTQQPGLIKQMGKNVPAPREDQRDQGCLYRF